MCLHLKCVTTYNIFVAVTLIITDIGVIIVITVIMIVIMIMIVILTLTIVIIYFLSSFIQPIQAITNTKATQERNKITPGSALRKPTLPPSDWLTLMI